MSFSDELKQSLWTQALVARKSSYSPYSDFKVGAALLCSASEEKIFSGTNVENVSFGACICAERTALVQAIHKGFYEFSALAVVADLKDDTETLVTPCGICLQMLSEFFKGDELIMLGRSDFGVQREVSFQELLPGAFKAKNLGAKKAQ